ncbi:MAG: RNA methyltransferase, TrmH family, group 3 [candidate division TM6 bacterium GW2011_GWF2_30_66]|nr:MAG: RNA methyltransferase, TrmH family, group 3 [candidate division TM6 bacterium GW2011_GWF2_30_66]
MKTINSRQNQEIKLVAELKTQKERQKQQKFVAEGLRTCEALFRSHILPERIYCTEKMLDNAQNLVKIEKISGTNHFTEIILVPDMVMEKISSASTPSGILCVFHIPKQPDLNKLSSGIVLTGISDPGNMGTLIRTCTAMGFETVISINCTDVFSPKVIQSSAGELDKINIFHLTWEELLKAKKHLKLIALVVSGGKNPENINFKDSLMVIGSEAHGIPEKWILDCDEKLTLPMHGKTESLNASVAGSIAMYLASVQK